MNKIAKFEKVSFEQYLKDMDHEHNIYNVTSTIGEKFTKKETEIIQKMIYDDIKLPVRSTSGAAGYDFYSPLNVELKPGEEIVIPTGIKCRIDDGWMLMIVPRSGLGFKYHMMLANTAGIIDSDYYNCEANEGHIMVKYVNRGNQDVFLKEGDKFAQGIFIPFGVTVDDTTDKERTGGFGSTGK